MSLHHTCQIPQLEKIYSAYFKEKIFFVEVGAFDGMWYSNTWGMGWDGILIEAHPDFAAQCKLVNPHQTVINAACGDKEGTIDLYEYGEVSTVKLSHWTKQWGINENTKKITVPLKTLNSILEENGVTTFDLLVVDVEDFEIEVLKGFDVDKYKPKMIIVELHELAGTGPNQKGHQEPWVTSYLKDYKKIYADSINTIYVR